MEAVVQEVQVDRSALDAVDFPANLCAIAKSRQLAYLKTIETIIVTVAGVLAAYNGVDFTRNAYHIPIVAHKVSKYG